MGALRNCEGCNLDISHTKHHKFCSTECASGKGRPRIERVCIGCGKIEYVQNKTQLKRKCRSCSQIGNTSSKNPSEEVRAKISNATKGRTPWNKGKTGVYSSESLSKMGASNKGRRASEESRAAISKGLKKFYKNKSGPNKGKSLSNAQRGSISKSLLKIDRCKYHIKDIIIKAESLGLSYTGDLDSNEKASQHLKVELKCKCGDLYQAKVQNFMEFEQHKRCKKCNNKGDSSQEQAIYNLVKNLIPTQEVLKGTKPLFMKHLDSRYQLDIYIPANKVAIEFHGLAFHSDRLFRTRHSIKAKLKECLLSSEEATQRISLEVSNIRKLHELKYELCKAAGVQLIQIFEDEWRDHRDIIESIIKSKLGISPQKIFARNCEFREVESKAKAEFFRNTHIAGDVNSKFCVGLYYKGELVSTMSLRGTWNKSYGDSVLEIARFASRLNTQVVGGFSKLLKRASALASEHGYNTLLTYADLRFGQGLVYSKNGFKFLKKTRPNYFYEKGGTRECRFKHKKSKDLIGATETEQQNLKGWYAIYDAGNNVYKKDL